MPLYNCDFGRCFIKRKPNNRRFAKPYGGYIINEKIFYEEVFLLDEEGRTGQFVSKEEALSLAKEKKLDLVLISAEKDAQDKVKPVVRILDLGRYKYSQKKKEKEKKEKQIQAENREIRITPTIAENDLKTKTKKAREFLLKGDRVKVTLRFRGREVTKKDFGLATLEHFFQELEDIAKKTKEPKFISSRLVQMLLELDKKKAESIFKNANGAKKQRT